MRGQWDTRLARALAGLNDSPSMCGWTARACRGRDDWQRNPVYRLWNALRAVTIPSTSLALRRRPEMAMLLGTRHRWRHCKWQATGRRLTDRAVAVAACDGHQRQGCCSTAHSHGDLHSCQHTILPECHRRCARSSWNSRPLSRRADCGLVFQSERVVSCELRCGIDLRYPHFYVAGRFDRWRRPKRRWPPASKM